MVFLKWGYNFQNKQSLGRQFLIVKLHPFLLGRACWIQQWQCAFCTAILWHADAECMYLAETLLHYQRHAHAVMFFAQRAIVFFGWNENAQWVTQRAIVLLFAITWRTIKKQAKHLATTVRDHLVVTLLNVINVIQRATDVYRYLALNFTLVEMPDCCVHFLYLSAHFNCTVAFWSSVAASSL